MVIAPQAASRGVIGAYAIPGNVMAGQHAVGEILSYCPSRWDKQGIEKREKKNTVNYQKCLDCLPPPSQYTRQKKKRI